MNAILIVLVPTQAGQPLTDQAGAVRDVVLVRRSFEEEAGMGRCQTSNRDQTTPPFWTWFIENPRRCGA